MEEYEPLQDHLLIMKRKIRDQLKAIDGTIEEKDMAIILAKSPLPLYENLVETLNITSGNVDLTIERVSNKLL